jgi:hypothetical protein
MSSKLLKIVALLFYMVVCVMWCKLIQLGKYGVILYSILKSIFSFLFIFQPPSI